MDTDIHIVAVDNMNLTLYCLLYNRGSPTLKVRGRKKEGEGGGRKRKEGRKGGGV
jgi:hypothetical protein